MRVARILSLPAQIPLLLTVLLVSGCIKQPHIGTEESGRRAVIWQQQDSGAETPGAKGAAKTERQLLTELREAEQKGNDDLGLATTLYNLAILRRQEGELAEAEQLYRRALAIRERIEGPNAADVATTLNNLAALEAARGDYDAAQPLLERALSIRETAIGERHALTAESLNNLALLYAARGNAADAEPLYQRAVAILEAEAGREYDLDRVLDNYAALLHDTGRDAEAEKLEVRARVKRAVER